MWFKKITLAILMAVQLIAPFQSTVQTVVAAQPPAGLTVLRSDGQGLTLALNSPAPALSSLASAQGLFSTIQAPGLTGLPEPGQPALPLQSFLIAAPPNARVSLQTTPTDPTVIRLDRPLAPVPFALQTAAGGIAGAQDDLLASGWPATPPGELSVFYYPDPTIYQGHDLFPQSPARVAEDGWLRDLRVLRIEIAPYQYNPLTAELLWHSQLQVNIDFSDQPLNPNHSLRQLDAAANPAFASLYQSVLNYPQAQSWHGIPISAQLNTQTSLGPRFRIEISEDGIYQIEYADLVSVHPEMAGANPLHFQMYSQGQPVAIQVSGESDGTFDPGDRILFYGEKFYGDRLAERYASENLHWRTYLRPLTNGAVEYWKPQFNALMLEKYTDQNVYFLTVGSSPGLRMPQIDGNPGDNPNPALPYYWETVRAEDSHFWWSYDFTSEETWFWDALTTSTPLTRTYTTTLSALASPPLTATVRAEIVAFNQSYLGSPDHHLIFSLNDTLLEHARWDGKSRYQLQAVTSLSNLLAGSNDFKIGVMTDTAVSQAYFFFDWFEIEYPREFQAREQALTFSTPLIQAASVPAGPYLLHLPIIAGNYPDYSHQVFQIHGFQDLEDLAVLDISEPLKPHWIYNASTEIDSVTFNAPGARFSIASGSGIRAASEISYYTPDDLLSVSNAAQYVLITHPEFLSGAQTLAELRFSQGLSTRVIDINDLYNEFNDGILHPIAIKNFIDYALHYWATAPTYVVLVGDGHWNFMDYATYKFGTAPNFMPPNLAWVDPYDGEVEATNLLGTVIGTDPLADVLLGRLPVNSPAEMTAVVDKMIEYETAANHQDWQMRITFVADNVPDSAGDFVALSNAIIDQYIDNLDPLAPDPNEDFGALTIYENDYGCISGKSCAAVRTAIADTLNITGTLILNYIGHGSVKSWSAESIWRVADLVTLQNPGQYPLVLSMTCLDGTWSAPAHPAVYPGLIETMLRQEQAGIIAAFSPTGRGVATGHDVLHRGFYDALFLHGNWILGSAAANAKVALYATGQNFDLLHTFTVFGDPALVIKNPDAEINDSH